jgi:hypothetical protein
LLSALLSPEIDLPPDIANFINNIPVATDNTILYHKRFLELTDDNLNDFVHDNENRNKRIKLRAILDSLPTYSS